MAVRASTAKSKGPTRPRKSLSQGDAVTPSIDRQVQSALAWLKGHSTKATLDGMARYAIPSDHAYGVAMRDIKALGKTLGRNHALAVALWDTGVYEARMLASFVGDPEQLTPAQMDRWCKEFDNWAFCDAMSFNLFDRSPHAWAKVTEWSNRRNEFEKRTAFALLWSLTVHDKRAGDEPFIRGLALIEREAGDERNFVKKAIEHGACARSASAIARSTRPPWKWRGAWRTLRTLRRGGWGKMRSGTSPVRV